MNNTFRKNFINITIFICLIWLSFLISKIIPINSFGIQPRTSFGLIGIFFSPFLHSSLEHITSNTLALLVFISLFNLVEGGKAFKKIIILILMSGGLTWLIGRSAIHIGASGLIFSLFGHLISLGFFKKKIILMLLSIILSAIYGHMIFGILPGKAGVSWEGHLAGFVSGIILARYYKS